MIVEHIRRRPADRRLEWGSAEGRMSGSRPLVGGIAEMRRHEPTPVAS